MVQLLLVVLGSANEPQIPVISVTMGEASGTLQCVVLFTCDVLQVMWVKCSFEYNIFNLMMDLPRLVIEKLDFLSL